jgi:hypothetical protein
VISSKWIHPCSSLADREAIISDNRIELKKVSETTFSNNYQTDKLQYPVLALLNSGNFLSRQLYSILPPVRYIWCQEPNFRDQETLPKHALRINSVSSGNSRATSREDSPVEMSCPPYFSQPKWIGACMQRLVASCMQASLLAIHLTTYRLINSKLINGSRYPPLRQILWPKWKTGLRQIYGTGGSNKQVNVNRQNTREILTQC